MPSGSVSGERIHVQVRPPTIDDVADAAGVSTATVSRVLNGGRVAEATRSRVATAMAQLGYRRNPHARGLVTGSSGTIGVLVPDVAGPLYAQMARGIEDVLDPLGMQFFLATDARNPERSHAALGSLLERRVDALILIGNQIPSDALRALIGDRAPLILVERETNDDVAAPTIELDNHGGAEAATRHLIERGYRRIAHVAGPRRAGAARIAGYHAAHAAAGLTAGPTIPAGFTEESGLAAAETLLGYDDVDAVFCINDRVALGLMHGLIGGGRRPGHDVAIVGFDDLPFARYLNPPLTTVRQDARALGRCAAEYAIAALEDRSPPHTTVVPTELVIRASSPMARG
jgi:DNA-binding LacI/PurR family transcriptional regulator